MFVFSVTAALVIGGQEEVSVIVPATEVVALFAAIALIRSLQVKAFASIQLAPTLAAIAGQGHAIIGDLYPRPYTAEPPTVRFRCRRGAARSCGRTARRPCSNSTWASCCTPPAAP